MSSSPREEKNSPSSHPTPQLSPAFLSCTLTFDCQSMPTHSAVEQCCYCFPRLCELRPQPFLHVVSTDQSPHYTTEVASNCCVLPKNVTIAAGTQSMCVGQILKLQIKPDRPLQYASKGMENEHTHTHTHTHFTIHLPRHKSPLPHGK